MKLSRVNANLLCVGNIAFVVFISLWYSCMLLLRPLRSPTKDKRASRRMLTSADRVARHPRNHAFAIQMLFTPCQFKFSTIQAKKLTSRLMLTFLNGEASKFLYSWGGSLSSQHLNARICNRSKIRPVPRECNLIFVHMDKTLVSNIMNGFFFQKDQLARISAFKCHEQSKRT